MKLFGFAKYSIALAALAAMVTSAHGVSLVVPGTADPWLANAAIDNVGSPEAPDTAPGQSPVLAGAVTPGALIGWSASGEVGHPGNPSGPDGNPGVLANRWVGANNGINDLPNTPINALIGVWAFSGGGGIAFYMGANGSAVVPAGVSQLFLGTMDGYGWANNTGSFKVELRGINTPDAGSTLLCLGLGMGAMGMVSRRRR